MHLASQAEFRGNEYTMVRHAEDVEIFGSDGQFYRWSPSERFEYFGITRCSKTPPRMRGSWGPSFLLLVRWLHKREYRLMGCRPWQR
jgi:hypothetical protein